MITPRTAARPGRCNLLTRDIRLISLTQIRAGRWTSAVSVFARAMAALGGSKSSCPNQGFSPTISKIDFIDQNIGWAVGWFGYAAHTTDGGINWQLQNIATINDQILGLNAVSSTQALAVGAPSGGSPSLYQTTNAGATWTKTPLPNQYSLSSIFALPSGNTWTSGYDRRGAMHKSGTVGTGIPCEDLLSFQARCKSGGGGHKLQASLPSPTRATLGNRSLSQSMATPLP